MFALAEKKLLYSTFGRFVRIIHETSASINVFNAYTDQCKIQENSGVFCDN